MAFKRGRKLFSLNYLFASFFGALMIASAYAYFNYKFAKFHFIDFGKKVFYEKKDIFKPKENEYIVVLFSSHQNNLKKIIKKIKNKTKILAIDVYQKRFENSKKIIYITSGINTILTVIQRFNIYYIPSAFMIKKVKNNKYKQESMVQSL